MCNYCTQRAANCRRSNVLENIHETKVLQRLVESRDAVFVLPLEQGTHHNRLARFLFLLQLLHATNEIVAADAAADNNSNSPSVDIFDVTSHTLIDSDSPAQILK